MRRAVITMTATVAGTVAVLVYQPGGEQAGADKGPVASGPTATREGSGAGGVADGATDPGSGDAADEDGSGGDDATGGASRGSTSGATTWVDGQAFGTRWGDVQVRVRFDGSTIVDVQAVQLPSADHHSAMLSQQAERILREEVLQAQSADVDMVSGATFTSTAYLQSLQAALDAR